MPSLDFELRDCQAWRDAGLPMSTTNNRAAKLYDATLSQSFGWFEDASLGGLHSTMQGMLQEDPQFVMGHVIKTSLNLVGNGLGTFKMADSKEQVANLAALAERDGVKEREKMYVQATDLLLKGCDVEALEVYQDILNAYPTDPLALRLIHELCRTTGQMWRLRDAVAGVKPMWSKSTPLYGYLYGLHAFALQETNMFEMAEKQGKLGLQWIAHDSWSRHALSHVYDSTKQPDKGIASLDSSVRLWDHSKKLVHHHYWHWTLFHIEKGDFEAALSMYDNELEWRALDTSTVILAVVDASSCLRRLTYEGVDIGTRERSLLRRTEALLGDHYWPFVDLHLMMNYCGSGRSDVITRLLDSVREFITDNVTRVGRVYGEVALPMLEAMYACEQEDYEKAVQLIYPIRYRLQQLGGSAAQREVFWMILIHAAMSSTDPAHRKLARLLVNERRGCVVHSNLDERMVARALALHD